MDKALLRSLRRIVIYMAPDEGRHFAESAKPRNHIFRDVIRVAKFLDLNVKDL